MRYIFLFLLFSVYYSNTIFAQGCCSGGSGSPIAGGASQGVLNKRQLELAANYQFIQTSKFYAKDKDTARLFDNLSSNYLYTRLAFGVTKDFTMSVESGYFFNKTIVDTNFVYNNKRINSSGIGDLILFPRYDIYNKKSDSSVTEITVGLGYKIPLGMHNDSMVNYIDTKGVKSYGIAPPTVQPTNGSHDFIFYAFFFKGFPRKKFRVFANALYVKKGWNSLGEKFGDYASVGLFGSATFFKRLGVTLQVKGEYMDKMQAAKKVNLLARYNVDIRSTGGRKVLFVPQLSYSYKNLSVYALTEIPLYQYVNGAQVGSQYQVTAGVSYRFCL